MKSENILIFCQAPADIQYVLTIYEKYKETNSISIFVINVKGIFDFIDQLNLKLEQFVFIPYELKSIKNIRHLFNERKRIKSLVRFYFSDIQGSEVYFFSRYEDWLTAFFVHEISANKYVVINYCNHYDIAAEVLPKTSKLTIRMVFYLVLLRYLTGIWFKVNYRDKLPEFNVNKYEIKEVKFLLDSNLFTRYQFYNKPRLTKKLRILFFIAPCDEKIFMIEEYNRILIDIIEGFRKEGYFITVKGHPRIGTPKLIKDKVDFIIPEYVPGEFINKNEFDLFLGINTSAIIHYTKDKDIPTYSLMEIFPANNVALHTGIINFLKQQSGGKIKFIKSIKDLMVICHKLKP
jgi:hypothetical protein